MPAPILLLPPSEGKAPGGRGAPRGPESGRFSELAAEQAMVRDALLAAMRDGEVTAGRLLGVKGAALRSAIDANLALGSARTMPASRRYTGVLYEALDYGGLDPTSRRRANQQVIIFSGLWGLVAPTDPLPDYKLKMGASLAGLGRLATFWRPQVTRALAPVTERRTVWDLLPQEHSDAWRPAPGSYRRRISVKFVDDVPDGGGRKHITVSHWNKLLKGSLVRFVLATQLDDVDGLAAFRHPEGYRYDPDLTERTGHAGREITATMVSVRG